MGLNQKETTALANAAVRLVKELIPYSSNIKALPKKVYSSTYMSDFFEHHDDIRKPHKSNNELITFNVFLNHCEKWSKRAFKFSDGVCDEQTRLIITLFKLIYVAGTDKMYFTDLEIERDKWGGTGSHAFLLIHNNLELHNLFYIPPKNYDKELEPPDKQLAPSYEDFLGKYSKGTIGAICDPWIWSVGLFKKNNGILSTAKEFGVSDWYAGKVYGRFSFEFNKNSKCCSLSAKHRSEEKFKKYHTIFEEPKKKLLSYYKEECLKNVVNPYKRSFNDVKKSIEKLISAQGYKFSYL